VTLSALIAEIEKATGRPARIERKPDQPGDVPVTFADVRRARERLGFEARVPLAEGIRRTVAWHRSHARAGAVTP
jgi:UDP-glucuronate 4-epimerase